MSDRRLTRGEFLAVGGKAAALLGLAAVLPSCTPAASPTPATPATPVPKPERVLRFAAGDFAGNLLDLAMGKGETESLISCMADGFFPLDIQTGKLTPGVIKKWELSPDGKTWALSLRNDVIFHDGSKLTAADIEYSLLMHQRSEAFQMDLTRATFGVPPKVQIVDDYTIRITTPDPSPRMTSIYSTLTSPYLWIFPKAYIEKNGIEYFRQHPIGTGPYKFVKLVPNDTMEFQAIDYPHWTGVVPDFKRVIISLVPEETTRIFMLEKGQIDVTHTSVESAIGLKKKNFGVSTGAAGVSQLNFIGAFMPEAKASPLADVRVREALSLAINRQEICDTLLGGIGAFPTSQQALNLDGTDVAPWLATKWKPRFKELYRYDVPAAKKLLQDAGFGSGFTFDIWSAPDSSAPYLLDIVTTLASYWKQIGVTANVIPVDSATWAANRRPTVNSMALVGKAGASATSLAKPVAAERLSYWTTKGGTLNLLVGSPDQAKLDGIYEQARKEIDVEKYTQFIDQGLEMTTKTWTCLSLVHGPLPTVYGPQVQVVMAPGSADWAQHFAYWKYTGK